MGNTRARVVESLDELQALTKEINDWYAQWEGSPAIGKHWTQLEFLAALTHKLLALLAAETGKIDGAKDAVTVYEECRQADERLLYMRRLWRWYADKFDQRSGEDDPMARTLCAADELIWSCWKTALKSLSAGPEIDMVAPLAYLSPQFAASAIRRAHFPTGLRPQVDKILEDHIGQLPIPVIALPLMCQRRPWWLVVAAHEVGHQIQYEFPELADRTAKALDEPWRRWHQELFADACAVLLMGPAVIWAITELETRPAPAPDKMLDSGYPPPPVRLAVVRAIAERAFPERDVARFTSALPVGDAGLDALLDCVPAVADALLGLTTRGGKQLRGLATATARAYETGDIGDWERKLRYEDKPDPERSLGAARFCVAGTVAVWQSLASEDLTAQKFAARTADLAGQVLGVLPDCAERGTRGGPSGLDSTVQAENLAERFAADLFATDLLADNQFPRMTGPSGRAASH
jgi:hypothetical protein